MANTYDLIAKSELTSTTATVTFTSIPATYNNLALRIVARTDTVDTNVNIFMRLNADSSNNYSSMQMSYYGTGANYNRNNSRPQLDNGPWAAGANLDANVFGTNVVFIGNYTRTEGKQINVLGGVVNPTSSRAWAIDEIAYYANTGAISSIQLPPYSGSYLAGSCFYLYGIKNS